MRNRKGLLTVQELIYALEAQPDLNAPVHLIIRSADDRWAETVGELHVARFNSGVYISHINLNEGQS